MKARLVESHRKAAENSRELGQALRELENVMETIPDVICILDLLGRLRLWNRNLEAATGLVAGDLAKRPLADLFAEDDRARIQATVRDAVRTGRFEAEGELVRPDGSRGAYHWTGAVLEDDHGALIGLTVSGRNITERKALEHELARQAFHDPLTGLPNRALFMDRVAHALSRTERRHGRVAVLFLDLDRFKIINDSLGHGIGDRLLGEVGQRLLCCLRPQDTIARLGGDEFGVLLEDILEVRDATVAAERIANALHAPFLFEGREMFVTTSVGIALGSTRGGDPEELLRRADLAMYHAKSKGKARYEVFDGRRGAPALDRLDLEIDLRGAIGREEFRVYFQPIVLLGPSRVMEVEALVRWQHARRGLLSPAEFIGLSEETGLIVPLGRWILAQACRQARAWQAAYPSEPPLVVSVNLSARQLQQPELVRETARILEETELDPGCLKLEITESVVMQDAPSALAKLRGLKELGVQLAIDDFGTGYSSLGYLKRFPVDTLKIDRSFVKGIDRDVESSAIVRAVVMMAKSLDLSVTAEGIETAEQLTRLEALGCDRGQGYYFAHPLPADPMGAFLAAWRGEHLVAPASRRNGRRGAKARRLAAAGRGGPTEAVTP
jgi:diguanylate cyclase (GGDEF)-like protein/PAS domain S-box-containing protein